MLMMTTLFLKMIGGLLVGMAFGDLKVMKFQNFGCHYLPSQEVPNV